MWPAAAASSIGIQWRERPSAPGLACATWPIAVPVSASAATARTQPAAHATCIRLAPAIMLAGCRPAPIAWRTACSARSRASPAGATDAAKSSGAAFCSERPYAVITCTVVRNTAPTSAGRCSQSRPPASMRRRASLSVTQSSRACCAHAADITFWITPGAMSSALTGLPSRAALTVSSMIASTSRCMRAIIRSQRTSSPIT
jgi:hypothetical protein